MMKLPDIANARLHSQQIATAAFIKPKDLVGYMGAIQAQDYAMSKWAIGLRLGASTDKQIENALDKGEILRTHVLRPTWHIVAATDIYWMLSLTAAKIKSLMKTMDKQLELNELIFTRSNKVIAKCVRDGKHADRDEIAGELEKAKITLSKNRLSHLLIRAELEQIICSGKTKGDKRTYALLADRVAKKKILNKDESLALLAKKYFTSRGPATTDDFSWWSGLSLTEARHGLEMVKSGLANEKLDGQTYWFANDKKLLQKKASAVFLMPAYDEFIISYKNRTASLALQHHKKVLSVNGIFYPVVISKGQVVGLWNRQFVKGKLHVEADLFQPQHKTTRVLIEKQAKIFGQFLAKDMDLLIKK